MDEIVVELLTVEKFWHYWPMIERELKTVPHIWQDFWTLDAIRERTSEGHFQCWAAGTSNQVKIVCWTNAILYPAGRVLNAFLMIGQNIDECIPKLDAVLEKYAQDLNCHLALVTGRRGWGAKLKSYGFRDASTSFTKRLDNRRLQ